MDYIESSGVYRRFGVYGGRFVVMSDKLINKTNITLDEPFRQVNLLKGPVVWHP